MTHYEIFCSCFPQLSTAESVWKKAMDASNLIEYREGGDLAGFAMTQGNALTLLCVAPPWQGRGIGSRLLTRAEENMRAAGEKKIALGGRLIPGAPEESKAFFEKRGYVLGEAYEEMRGDLRYFSAEAFSLPVPDGAVFGWYKGDLAALHTAVRAVDPGWVQYFSADSPVFSATVEGEIASFCNAEVWESCVLSNGQNKVGAPGCVGTVPAFRRRGIGLKMVALACEELKRQGCDTCYIHYTGVAHWYARLGFFPFLAWRPCSKSLV